MNVNNNMEIHPYEPYIDNTSNKLIIGTMPPPRFCKKDKELYPLDVDFYYGSKDNQFWDILSEVFNTPLSRGTTIALSERKNLLSKYNIGMCDIIKQVKRKKQNSSSDDDLISDNNSFLDIVNILNQYPNIKTLIYTSNKVRSFMYNATKSEHRNINDKIQLTINHKIYDIYILPSPSKRNTLSYKNKILKYKEIL